MRKQTTIRQARAQDAATIHRLIAAAFAGAEHTDHNEQFIFDGLLRAGALSLSLVAEQNDQLVGQLAASPVTLSDGSSGWYGLGPVSVAPDCQRQGIGSALVTEALAQLRAAGAQGCVLLGDPAYYGRFGFRVDPHLRLPQVPPEYFQSIIFQGQMPEAEVSYHPAFYPPSA